MLKTVEPQYMGFAKKLVCVISSSVVGELSELRFDC